MNKEEFKNLKVGDKVRVKVDDNCLAAMKKWDGAIMTIREICLESSYGDYVKMKEDRHEGFGGNGWKWYDYKIVEKVGVSKKIKQKAEFNRKVVRCECGRETTYDDRDVRILYNFGDSKVGKIIYCPSCKMSIIVEKPC